jgi:hypothetical protein
MTGMLKSGSFRLRPNACSTTVLATSDEHPTAELGEIVELPEVGGFQHRYEQRAA